MIVAATGHRPDKLGGYSEGIHARLLGLAFTYLEAERPERIISGMALGWDQAFAEAAFHLDIPLVAAVPFEGFDRRWPARSCERLQFLLFHAAEVYIVSPYPGARAMQLRNEWMVDRADSMAALWDGSWGGTFNCIQYAEKRQKPVTNLWERWQRQVEPLKFPVDSSDRRR